ncbi:hypothetical protein O9X98_07250 [Agrobacterium salinitolerans]|nr:hypothetical protein [Agrobacterium salinitolerans]
MAKMVLPYLTSSLSSLGRTGKIKFGWLETQVEVKDADSSEFSFAACKVINGQNSSNIYESRGMFWASALYCVRGVLFNADGIRGEAPYRTETADDINWIRVLAQEVLCRRLNERARAAGSRVGKDVFGNMRITASLKEGDGHESDRALFAQWAEDNLLMVDGRLMKRVHSPDMHIGWRFHGNSLNSACVPVRGSFYSRGYGSHNFYPGLHFRLGDPAFEESWAAAEQAFGVPIGQADMAHNRFYVHAISDELQKHGIRDRMVIHDNVVYDPSVLASVSDGGWEDMGQRSAISIAESIAATTSPHLHQDGPKRAALEELKRLVRIVPENRPDDFKDLLDAALSSLPTAGKSALAWFIDQALDQWNDREIALSPSPHVGLFK